ncbi:MAG: sulfur oxidation c-type cytochrome SoxA [Rubrivivax sp.]
MRRALLLALALVGTLAGADDRRSGLDFMTPATQALQRDDGLNPAMLWVRGGEAAWSAPAGAAQRSCRDCHGDAPRSMRGVAARHPAWDAEGRRVLTLGSRINACRVRHQRADALPAEGEALLSLEAWVAMASRGQPVAPPDDARLQPLRERGRLLYTQRLGQLELACADCHDRLAGRRLGGSVIPQAHPTGYPIYRLEWQSMGSLQRRLRNCFAGVRAEVPAYGADDLVALELHLMQRAAGMALESPGVRP